MMTTVNVVPQKQIVHIWYFAPYFEKLHDVPKLAVYISYQSDWAIQIANIILFSKDVLGLLTNDFDCSFIKLVACFGSFDQGIRVKTKFVFGRCTKCAINIRMFEDALF